jgi:hypothetical protein
MANCSRDTILTAGRRTMDVNIEEESMAEARRGGYMRPSGTALRAGEQQGQSTGTQEEHTVAERRGQ